MGVIAEFSITSAEFPFGTVVSDGPEMDLELDRIAPHGEFGVPYLWAIGDDHATFEASIRDSPLVESLEAIDRIDDSVLYKIEWQPNTGSLLQEIARVNAGILEGFSEGEHWFFRIRFDEHQHLTTFNEHCSDLDINYRLRRVYSDNHTGSRSPPFDLSVEQRDALLLAVERGYFRVPREVTLQELGGELDVSPQAVSERIRRGTDRILQSVLAQQQSVAV